MEMVEGFESWIGFDLDGTLAESEGWRGITHIGKPIEKMWRKVHEHLNKGDKVKIFTARLSGVNGNKAIFFINAWLDVYHLPKLEITNIKDHGMRMLYDDRVVQVERNTGELIGQVQDWMVE